MITLHWRVPQSRCRKHQQNRIAYPIEVGGAEEGQESQLATAEGTVLYKWTDEGNERQGRVHNRVKQVARTGQFAT